MTLLYHFYHQWCYLGLYSICKVINSHGWNSTHNSTENRPYKRPRLSSSGLISNVMIFRGRIGQNQIKLLMFDLISSYSLTEWLKWSNLETLKLVWDQKEIPLPLEIRNKPGLINNPVGGVSLGVTKRDDSAHPRALQLPTYWQIQKWATSL